MERLGPLAASLSGTHSCALHRMASHQESEPVWSCGTDKAGAKSGATPEVNRQISDEGARHDQGKRYVSQYARGPLRPRLLSRQAHAALESSHGRCLQVLYGG